jgi:hypothetical protein
VHGRPPKVLTTGAMSPHCTSRRCKHLSFISGFCLMLSIGATWSGHARDPYAKDMLTELARAN